MDSKLVQTRAIARRVTHRRDVHDLVVAILTLARTARRKTHIITKIGLSHDQATTYLGCLEESGFIAENSGMWKTTEKGKNVIEACKMCREIAHGFDQQTKSAR